MITYIVCACVCVCVCVRVRVCVCVCVYACVCAQHSLKTMICNLSIECGVCVCVCVYVCVCVCARVCTSCSHRRSVLPPCRGWAGNGRGGPRRSDEAEILQNSVMSSPE